MNARGRSPGRRALMLAGTVLVAVIVVVVAIIVSSNSGGSVSRIPKSRQAAQSVASQVQALLAGIPQSGSDLGARHAPVTMTYYGDLQCPYCAAFTVEGGFPALVANDVRAGKVRVDYRSFCTATCNDYGPSLFLTQQVAAYSAGHQDKFWQYAELFYHEQGPEGSGYVTEQYLEGLARQIAGLNLTTWQTYRKDPFLVGQVDEDALAAKKAGVRVTPTLIMKGPRGTRLVPTPSDGIPTYSDLQQTVNQVS